MDVNFELSFKFDAKRLMENIYAVIEQKDLKISEVEKASGLSVGYLSRIAKSEKSFPSLESVWRISQALGVSLDWLIEGDGRPDTDQAAYLKQFIQRLFDQTKAGQLDWGKVTLWDVNTLLTHGNRLGFPAIEESQEGHPFMPGIQFPGMDPAKYSLPCAPDGSRRIRAYTRYESSVVIGGTSFYAALSETQRLYLIPYLERMVSSIDENGDALTENALWYELLAENREDGSVNPICNTLFGNESVKPAIQKLYTELQMQENGVRIRPGIRSIIDGYMERTAPLHE